ncbi:MAG TPA: hypothetical protein VNX02_13305 [Steroidobacteraceae bacterium]|nr:hypothetical protein [Steroidobacteraceae bacterium]
METVTVFASRQPSLGLSEAEILIGSALVVALLAWTVLRHLRGRQQPHA